MGPHVDQFYSDVYVRTNIITLSQNQLEIQHSGATGLVGVVSIEGITAYYQLVQLRYVRAPSTMVLNVYVSCF
jgi:hypothetical protein